MLELNKINYKEVISKGRVVVDYWAPWCGPCRAMAPIFEELSKEFKKVKFTKLNVDENQEIASKLGIQGIPTLILFKEGKEIKRRTGLLSKSALKELLEDNFS